MPCGKFAPNARYFLKIPDHTQSEEILVLCSFWDSVASCGLYTGTDGRSSKDCGDT